MSVNQMRAKLLRDWLDPSAETPESRQQRRVSIYNDLPAPEESELSLDVTNDGLWVVAKRARTTVAADGRQRYVSVVYKTAGFDTNSQRF